ncbi:putative glutathione S-transferase [Capsicum chinense]|nr:putative glutathione S-transferase [Capsicum chinense]
MSKLEGPSILPKDPYDRALARASIANTFFLNGEEQEKAKEEVCEMLKVLDNELKAKKFFVGDKFGFAAANFVGHWLGVFVFGEMSILVVAKSRNIHFHKEELLAFAQARALASASASARK